MSRLSIVIPLSGTIAQFEQTLVSVLEHRPEDCEIIVVHGGEYSDPYSLDEEVRFVTVAKSAPLEDRLVAGVDDAAGDFVHTLQCGVTVEKSWAAAAIACFDEPKVAMVATMMLHDTDATRLSGCGVRLSLAGCRQVSAAGKKTPLIRPPRVDGPMWSAGFYRRDVLQSVLPLAARIGTPWFDLNLALLLGESGWECVLADDSVVRGSASVDATAGFRAARSQERLFWQHLRATSAMLTLPHHGCNLLCQTLALCMTQPWHVPGQLLGRLVGFCTPIASSEGLHRPAKSVGKASRIPAPHVFGPSMTVTSSHRKSA